MLSSESNRQLTFYNPVSPGVKWQAFDVLGTVQPSVRLLDSFADNGSLEYLKLDQLVGRVRQNLVEHLCVCSARWIGKERLLLLAAQESSRVGLLAKGIPA
jgi:hypothetical protein